MPDVVVVGGGIIGTACALELTRAGASVTLLERGELAAGASGRNLGYLDTSKDPVLAPLARASLELYVEAVEAAPFPVFLDREPIGTLALSLDEDELDDLRAWAEAARAVDVDVEPLSPGDLRGLEPELSPAVLEAFLLHEGRRVDPLALTIALAEQARSGGAEIRHHAPARRAIGGGGSVLGVVTDDGPVHADVTVLAAGPWSPSLVRPLGIALPVTGARGWLVQVLPERPTIRHWIQSGARRLLAGHEPTAAAELPAATVSLGAFADDGGTTDVSPMIQPAPDGSVLVGTSREPAFADEAFGLDVPRAVARQAARIVPALEAAPVAATWSGVRPLSPDERPIVGALCDGLVAATAHGSEGVILAGGTARLVRALVAGEEPPFDLAPLSPARFG